MKSVAIILVNWNGKADTLACLQSLGSDGYEAKHVIVVDNGSVDDSIAAIRAEFPQVDVIAAGRNLGFTGGNNLGMRQAIDRGVDYVLLLNNDTTVEAGVITSLISAADAHPRAGVLTPIINYFDEPDQPWFAGSEIDLRRGQAVHENSSPPDRTEKPRSIPWASGCAMLIPAEVIKHVGGFDDRFFLNWEDVDLSLRIRAAGYEILLVPAARVYHKVGRSFAGASGAGRYYYVRNHLLLWHLHFAASRYKQFQMAVGHLRESVHSFRVSRFRAPGPLVATSRALIHHILRRYGPMACF